MCDLVTYFPIYTRQNGYTSAGICPTWQYDILRIYVTPNNFCFTIPTYKYIFSLVNKNNFTAGAFLCVCGLLISLIGSQILSWYTCQSCDYYDLFIYLSVSLSYNTKKYTGTRGQNINTQKYKYIEYRIYRSIKLNTNLSLNVLLTCVRHIPLKRKH